MMAPAVFPVDRLELAYRPRAWAFAEENRASIERHFAACRENKPHLWNGRVLLLREYALCGRTMRGEFFEAEFASFLAWRDWGFPDRSVANCFAQGALRASDGAFLLGVMSPRTANAGRIYFPSGTPEPGDMRGDRVDLAGSLMREVAEETGLTSEVFLPQRGWRAVPAGPRLALIKVLNAPQPAEALRERILGHVAADPAAELSDVRIVRDARDFDPMMPDFVIAFLRDVWESGDAAAPPPAR
jgi:8-oxo-dGTP pyrophosphatase MutT (NUDIX family)